MKTLIYFIKYNTQNIYKKKFSNSVYFYIYNNRIYSFILYNKISQQTVRDKR